MNIHKPKPSSIVAIIVLFFFLTPFIWIGVCELNKARLDKYIDKKCLEQPGVVFLDYYYISRENYRNLPRTHTGDLNLKKNSSAPLYIEGNSDLLFYSLSAKISVHTISIRAAKTDRVLAYYRYYSRLGGGAPLTVSHPSSRRCKMAGEISGGNLEDVFIIKN